MLRKVISAFVVLVLCVGFTLADEIRAVITKVDGDKVTFAEVKGGGRGKGGKGKGGTIEKGPEKTLPVTSTVKVVKGKFDKETKKWEAGEAIEKGLKSDTFTKIDAEKGVPATIITDADNKNITEIRVTTGGRGGKKGKDK
jgi:hypothetical protein